MDNYYLEKGIAYWELKKQNDKKFIVSFPRLNKKEAVQAVADYVHRNHSIYPLSVKIRKLDGTFEEERTYPRSADPRESEG